MVNKVSNITWSFDKSGYQVLGCGIFCNSIGWHTNMGVCQLCDADCKRIDNSKLASSLWQTKCTNKLVRSWK